MKNINILVTGAGAGVGQGILRSLRMMKETPRIITADPDCRAAGHWLGNKGYVIPFINDPKYASKIESIIKEEKIDIIFVGTDVELSYFAANKEYLESFGAKVVVCPLNVINIADDKWLTVQFLKNNGFPYPRSALATDTTECIKLAEECGYPLFGKPRCGARSIGARIIKNSEEYIKAQSYEKNLIFQELLPDTCGEFTAGCVGSVDGKINGVVVLRRDLKDGNTYRAYYDGNNKFEQEIIEVASKLGIKGSCNFQFRVKDNQPVIFEINARFSGTTPLRAIFGFNEVEAILNNVLNGIDIIKPQLSSGTVLRVWSDVFISNDSISDFNKNGQLNNPNAIPINFIK